MKQREFMKALVSIYGRDEITVCNAYAAAERDGQVSRRRKALTPEKYAKALWNDAHRQDGKGWL